MSYVSPYRYFSRSGVDEKKCTACKTVSDDVDIIINDLYRVGEVMPMS